MKVPGMLLIIIVNKTKLYNNICKSFDKINAP